MTAALAAPPRVRLEVGAGGRAIQVGLTRIVARVRPDRAAVASRSFAIEAHVTDPARTRRHRPASSDDGARHPGGIRCDVAAWRLRRHVSLASGARSQTTFVDGRRRGRACRLRPMRLEGVPALTGGVVAASADLSPLVRHLSDIAPRARRGGRASDPIGVVDGVFAAAAVRRMGAAAAQRIAVSGVTIDALSGVPAGRAAHVAEHGRELRARPRRRSPRSPRSVGRDAGALDRRDLEAFVRSLMAGGLSPRSTARAVACVRGFYQVPGGGAAAARAVRPTTCGRRARGRRCRSSSTWRKSIVCSRSRIRVDAARPARQGADLGALRDRPARDRADLAEAVATCISTRATSPASARATRSASSRSARKRPTGCGDTWRKRGRAWPRPVSPWLFVNARGAPLSRVGILEAAEGVRHQGGHHPGHQPPRAAAFLRDPSARPRRRSARHPDDAGPRRPVDDADLHARAGSAAAVGLRPFSSPRLTPGRHAMQGVDRSAEVV